MRFALAGNPNSGKTTLFNALTGSTAHVGNWPGVTVDRKEGSYKKLGEKIDIIDLPGIYSLSPYSPEEVIARNYIIDELPDVIINIVDATNIERNLYLTTQLMETDRPIVVALNMMDAAQRSGIKIDIEDLERRLGLPVCAISALNGKGLDELMKRAYAVSNTVREGASVLMKGNFAAQLHVLVEILKAANVGHPVFHAVKLLEGDELETKEQQHLHEAVIDTRTLAKIDPVFEQDFEAAVADARYRYIVENYKKAIITRAAEGALTYSDKIDVVLTHKYLGIPIFMAFMFLVFHFTFGGNFLGLGIESPGVMMQTWMGEAVGMFSGWLEGVMVSLGASDWALGLVVSGVVEGVGAVLSFLPQILMLFFFLSIMEDTGYMARAAFLMDRILRRFGLSGRAFMPLLMGFGCSVPAIMGTRTLASDRERKISIILMPFFSCGAKLPIWALFAAAFFPTRADMVVFGVYFFGIAVAMITAIILSKVLKKGKASSFLMELPAYHIPQARSTVVHLWDKLKHFVGRATTVIAGATIVIWFLSNFSFGLQMVEANSAQSILGIVGAFVQPIFVPLGFASGAMGWKAVVAIVTGLIAKEMVVSSMGVLYAGAEGDALEDDSARTALMATIVAVFSPAAALSFMAFNLLSIPCMAAVAAANAEFGKANRKWTFISIGIWMSTAYIASFLIFNIGTLLGF